MSQSTALGPSVVVISVLRVVAEVRREPLLRLTHRPALALGVRRHLVGPETADDEVLRLRVGEVPAADRGAGPHRHRVRELDAGALLDVEELPQGALLGVLGAGGIAGGG